MPKTIKPPKARKPKGDRKALHRLIENDLIRRVSYTEYRDKVQRVYGGQDSAFAGSLGLGILLPEYATVNKRLSA